MVNEDLYSTDWTDLGFSGEESHLIVIGSFHFLVLIEDKVI